MVASALTILFQDEPINVTTSGGKANKAEDQHKQKNQCKDGLGGSGFQIMKDTMTDSSCSQFRMPLHYPRYTKEDYEAMPEWKLDQLLADYGLPASGNLADKKQSAMGAFLWDPESNETKRSTNIREANSDGCRFQMPLHYPKYTKKDYEAMEECKLDHLLAAYGLPDYTHCDLAFKREFAATTFLWSQSDSTHQDATTQCKIAGVLNFFRSLFASE